MNLVKWLITLPAWGAVLLFAFVNNDLATFSLWPFAIEATVSLSVAILLFFTAGFTLGWLHSFLACWPKIRSQKKLNKKLEKVHSKLAEQFEVLQEDLDSMKRKEEEAARAGLEGAGDGDDEGGRPGFFKRLFSRFGGFGY